MNRKHRINTLLIAILFSLISTSTLVSSTQASSCYQFSWNGNIDYTFSLQSALNNASNYNYCVVMGATASGQVFYISNQITIPAYAHLIGAGMDPNGTHTTLKADPQHFPVWWGGVYSSSMIYSGSSLNNTEIYNLILDGSGAENLQTNAQTGAVFDVSSGNITVDHVLISHARCSGVEILDTGMIVRYSTLENNGQTVYDPPNYLQPIHSPGCGPPSAAIWMDGQTSGKHNLNPWINSNVFDNNAAGAIDDDEVDGGLFQNNNVYNNGGPNNPGAWAAVSLYQASGWYISGNSIAQPESPVLHYHLQCEQGPSGYHAAAIRLCADNQDPAKYRPTTNNTIRDNPSLTGPYGIIAVGNEEGGGEGSGVAPSGNYFYNNNVSGSGSGGGVGCADDNSPGANTWPTDPSNANHLNNNCHGSYTVNPGPAPDGYF